MHFKSLVRKSSLLALACLFFTGCFSFKQHGELGTANFVNIQQILGTYYVVGTMPTLLDRNPTDATFQFTQQPNGTLSIAYSFRPKGPDSAFKTYTGRARIDEIQTNADWSIQFLWPFENDYRVIYANEDQSILLIGHPTRNYLYMLSRSKVIDYETREWLLDFSASRGFDTSFFKLILQN
tara:strand:- start:143471 stop:144013 length:543 start_codon:yes stop_codon:yes gene_type:complete